MAWDDDKSAGDVIASQDWDDMVADQKDGWRRLGEVSGTGVTNISTSWSGNYRRLMIIIWSNGFSVGTRPTLRFNSDSGNNYGAKQMEDNDATTEQTDTNWIELANANNAQGFEATVFVYNENNRSKRLHWNGVRVGTIASTAPDILAGAGIWENTSAYITDVQLRAASGNLTNARLIVFGSP